MHLNYQISNEASLYIYKITKLQSNNTHTAKQDYKLKKTNI